MVGKRAARKAFRGHEDERIEETARDRDAGGGAGCAQPELSHSGGCQVSRMREEEWQGDVGEGSAEALGAASAPTGEDAYGFCASLSD